MHNIIIKRLLIRSYSGIGKHAAPVDLNDLAPGINLLWGPNRRGKSCTARAITALLWGGASEATDASVEAVIVIGDDTAVYQYNAGCHEKIVETPPRTFAGLYRLSLQDLLSKCDGDIAAKLREELYGNLDLKDAAQRLSFNTLLPAGYTRDAAKLREARAERTAISTLHQSLRENADTLASRERRLDTLRTCIDAAAHLELLRELQTAKAAHLEAKRQLALFGEAGSRLVVLSQESYNQLLERCDEFDDTNARIRTATDTITAADETLESGRFNGECMPDDEWFDVAEKRLRKLETATTDIETCTTEVDTAQITADHRQKAVDSIADTRDVLLSQRNPFPIPAAVKAADSAQKEAARIQQEIQRSEADQVEQQALIERIRDRLSALIPAERIDTWISGGTELPAFGNLEEAQASHTNATFKETTLEAQLAEARTAHTNLEPAGTAAREALPKLNDWFDEHAQSSSGAGAGTSYFWVTFGLLVACILALAILVHIAWFIALAATGVVAFKFKQSRSGAGTPEKVKNLPDGVNVSQWTAVGVLAVIDAQKQAISAADSAQTKCNELQGALRQISEDLQRASGRIDEAFSTFVGTLGDGADKDCSFDAAQLADLHEQFGALSNAADKSAGARVRLGVVSGQYDEHVAQCVAQLPYLDQDHRYTVAELENEVGAACDLLEAAEKLAGRATDAAKLLDDANRELQQRQAAVDAGDCTRIEALAALYDHFSVWCDDDDAVTDAIAFRSLLDELRKAEKSTSNAVRDRRAAETSLKTDSDSLDTQRDRIAAEFTRLQLPVEPETWRDGLRELASLLPQLDDYNATAGIAEKKRLGVELAESRIDDADVDNELLELNDTELASRLEAIDGFKADKETVNEEIIKLKKTISDARLDTALESANAAEKCATASLEDVREQTVASAVGKAVLDVLERHYQSTGSATLKDAGRRLRSFTNDRYDLALSSGSSDALVAIDRRKGDVEQPLDELSSNTRAQALIAARLAFLHAQEKNVRPPLIVDEALAMADPDGADSVMDAILSEARLGRQVFYFTAQPNEINEWKTFLDALSDTPEWIIHDGLGSCPDVVDTASPWQPAPLLVPADDESTADYAMRLGVPAVDPWKPVSEIHPYFLLDDDTQLLHAVIPLATSVGELIAFIDRVGTGDVASRIHGLQTADIACLTSRLDIVDDCLTHWRSGRDKPLTPGYLKTQKLLSLRQLQATAKLLQEVAGDPAKFVDRITEADGIGGGKQANLRAELIASGRLSDGVCLDQPAALRRLRQDFPDNHSDIALLLPRLALGW